MSSLRVTAGSLRGRRVPVPSGDLRPTSERARQAFFNIVGDCINGARFLDLFAGSGVFSFEAVSRGAASATAVEQDHQSAAAIERLGKEWNVAVNVVARDVFAALPHLTGPFEVVFADPPYNFARYDELIDAIGRKVRLAENPIVAIEHRRGDGLKAVPHGADNTAGPMWDGLQPVRTAEYGEVWITFFTR